jgi:hypothetical protein
MPTKKNDRPAFQKGRHGDAQKLLALCRRIKVGVDALERGDFIEIDAQDLDAYLNGLVATGSR